ncbi:hypothetical protein [Hyphococcus luteus]|uniref:DUF945 domain-containing protein n=1 Tax=Hyphococcus luteus TaxID=2058213 RepID=A0A2S7K610_9PROT|nr:hypothetical protein [Marinicaulis flavus]PQA87943.1 hypothetical protein CW354_06290 [Marinicaulis flavus]
MKLSNVLLAGAAALALVSCGKKEGAEGPSSETSAAAAKADAGSPLDKKFTLKDAEPTDIDALLALMPEKSRPAYETATFDDALGATVVENLRFADADDGEGVTVARAEFYGVDMDAIERVKTAEKTGPDAPFETVFQKVRFLDVASQGLEEGNEAVRLTIGGVEFDKLQIRQGGVEGDGAGNEAARFFNAVNLAGVYFKDLSFGTESGDAPTVSMSAPDLRFVGLGGGKLGAIIANDLEYDVTQSEASLAAVRQAMGPQGAMLMNSPLGALFAPKRQHVKTEQLQWRDIDFAGLLSWGLKGEQPPASETDLIDLGTMKATNMETFVNGKRAVTVAEANMTAGEFTWLAPSNIKVDSKDAVYDFTAYVPETEEEALKVLKDHGLDHVEGDGTASWVWNSKSGAADLTYEANMKKFANFDLGLGFGDFKLADIAAAMEDGDDEAILTQGAFKNFSMKLEDEKALDAVFALAALQMGGTGEDLRASVPAMIRLSGAQVAQMNERVTDYVNALADFVAEGGSLEVAATPAEPVPFATLQTAGATAPQTLPDVIDLTVTHEK